MVKERLITCFVLAILIFFPIASVSSLADGCVRFIHDGSGNSDFSGCYVRSNGNGGCGYVNPQIGIDNGQLYELSV
ncbi:MAG: hypothetical protein KKC75_04280 [Nanoarchaeota archaeon]|nr:hypothetical protein [Nanoarchaeota archaeon]MBU1005374.1 hypothetical protein [Nanoarchaeota archaeon]MBU1946070.1 hypothetical protein [Nanoarchaeota archaeon]